VETHGGGAHGGGAHGVVALGDSWLTGYGLPLAGLSCLSWAGWLAWALPGCLTQHAVNGARAEQVARDQVALLPRHRYQLGVAWLGANDFSRLDGNRFTSPLTAICTGLQESCDVVAMATLPAAMRTPDLSWRANAIAIRRVNDYVREVAAETGVTLVELQDALAGPWAMAPDKQHPTSLGQLEAAHVAAGSLTSVPLLRALPDPADRTPPKVQKRMYDVSIRDRVRGSLVSLRQRRAESLPAQRARH
jgi:hypothetical protein